MHGPFVSVHVSLSRVEWLLTGRWLLLLVTTRHILAFCCRMTPGCDVQCVTSHTLRATWFVACVRDFSWSGCSFCIVLVALGFDVVVKACMCVCVFVL